jgi:hypothetical protein
MIDWHARIENAKAGEPENSGENMCQKLQKSKCKNETKIIDNQRS